MSQFEEELKSRGAREFQIVALSADETRALAAVAEAERRGVEHVIPYALSLYDDPAWTPTGAKPRVSTNLSVERSCEVCDGDRFVLHRTRQPEQTGWMRERGIEPGTDAIEEVKPCPGCNAEVDAGFWKANGERFKVAT